MRSRYKPSNKGRFKLIWIQGLLCRFGSKDHHSMETWNWVGIEIVKEISSILVEPATNTSGLIMGVDAYLE